MSTVFAIDPGPDVSTAVVYDGTVVCIYRDEPNRDMLSIIETYRGGVVFAIEDIEAMGMAVGREVFQTVRWSGRMQQVALQRLLHPALYGRQPVVFVPRTAVKLHLCGSRRAKGENVRLALIDKWGGSVAKAIGKKRQPGPLYGIADHAWSALAVAVTYLETMDSPEAL